MLNLNEFYKKVKKKNVRRVEVLIRSIKTLN